MEFINAKITIFTPTYNRAYIIEKLYYSLQRQKNKSFEWLVVDDGSTDDTTLLFDKWMKEDNGFSIRYYKIANGGKHRAVNYGLDLAQCEYFMVVDSDDYLTDDAIEKICRWMQPLKNDTNIMGIVANKGYTEIKTRNEYFEANFLDRTLLEMNTYLENGKKVLSGERAICFKTAFHRLYKYPEFVGEKFVTEAVVYNRMANDGYKMRFFNDIIWIYEYQEDGLSNLGSELYVKNPRGYGVWVREYNEFSGIDLFQRFRMYYSFTCELLDKYETRKIAECIGTKTVVINFIYVLHIMIKFFKRLLDIERN